MSAAGPAFREHMACDPQMRRAAPGVTGCTHVVTEVLLIVSSGRKLPGHNFTLPLLDSRLTFTRLGADRWRTVRRPGHRHARGVLAGWGNDTMIGP
jgi:hypothetical protein